MVKKLQHLIEHITFWLKINGKNIFIIEKLRVSFYMQEFNQNSLWYSGRCLIGSRIVGSIGKWDKIYLIWQIPNYHFLVNVCFVLLLIRINWLWKSVSLCPKVILLSGALYIVFFWFHLQQGPRCADGTYTSAIGCCSYKPCNIFCCNCDDVCRGGVVYKDSFSFKMNFFKTGLDLI